ncbi:MAG: hypothetical protein OEZ01_02205 [Candidatus Heimdallarchaeota archaeon]|nr:hypothetical protein [Candidatus Heimdallarchaeota archaeon]MDH5644788.1 hypothetical protein [Candidatus Heimdallarchaeota archaeon]
MINSKTNLKKYFLPVYVVWVFIIPTVIILLQLNLTKGENSLFTNLDWNRVPAIYASFGVVWPISIFIFPAFYYSYAKITNYSFIEALSNFDDPQARLMIFTTIMSFIVWIAPLIHLGIAFSYHKKFLEKENNTEIKWIDYFGGFI